MMVVSPVRPDERLSVGTHNLCAVVKSIGTDLYGETCFGLLEKALNAEHWAVFRLRSGDPLKCVATASGRHRAAALENINRFVVRCHSLDPSIRAASERNAGPTLIKVTIDDLEDRQHRHCFRLTQVQERLSFFSWTGTDLYQLSVFRGPRMSSFSALEMNSFATLAQLLLVTAQKHEVLAAETSRRSRHLDIKGIERLLKMRSPALSTRECEVCARAVAGKTIEGTSLDLSIARTSVITYRQRAYQKLGISRANELVALLNDLHADRALAS
jgi:DNA-binding CsgD family transcriptional regulator